MERLVRIDQSILRGQEASQFALQQIFKELGVGYEYLVDGAWIPGPPIQKPEGRRAVFDNIEFFRAARDAYSVWQDITARQVDRPVFPEEGIRRILKSRLTGAILWLFTPWGPAMRDLNQRDETVLDELVQIKNIFITRGINTQVLVMPADSYATEINQIESARVGQYCLQLEEASVQRGLRVERWSVLRQRNRQRYRELARAFEEGELPYIGADTESAYLSALRRFPGNREKALEAVYDYLRERVVEAEIVEGIFRPIKISLADKNRDNGVDRNLPRLYVVPNKLRTPWLEKGPVKIRRAYERWIGE